MRKLILRNQYSPGDVVMLTAAVRDLHRWYPGRYLTDVRTSCPELWENNPWITALADDDPEVRTLDCTYPLIDFANETPFHCLHGFIEFLNRSLGLRVRPTAFHGDIHLSVEERAWYSQVQESTRRRIPFWIVSAGGKHDVTIKWWDTERFQAVIDHYQDRIQFAQVGRMGHHHPKLNGVIDLRGRTTLRELVRLVYHAQGVLCPVTALMHLAAAVPMQGKSSGRRPCVVIAGGREPAHWEAYPGHQFLHTIGSLPCCLRGGCWRDRTLPLGDGDPRDREQSRCVNVVGQLPRCMDMIRAEEVIQSIDRFFEGSVRRFLTKPEREAARRGVEVTRENPFDQQRVTLAGVRRACEEFRAGRPPYPGHYQGRGIVVCAGGVRYFTNAWVAIHLLRQHGCRLPIQVWHLGPQELDDSRRRLLEPLGVTCVDAFELRQRHPARRLAGWELKPYAILHSPFREVLLLDADNMAVVNPEFLFESQPYRAKGAVFWPDYGRGATPPAVWRSLGLRRPPELEFESGQILVDKERCWASLTLALWMNEHSDFFYRHVYGDKETFHLAFRKERQPYALVPHPIHPLPGTMCQHDFEGRRIFQHRNSDKWNLFLHNRRVRGFRLEEDCRAYVRKLQQVWDGGAGSVNSGPRGRSRASRRRSTAPKLLACMISCPERLRTRQATLRRLKATDWGEGRVQVGLDEGVGPDHRRRQARLALRVLRCSLDEAFDYLLFLEDDLAFNRHFYHNVLMWPPVRQREMHLAGLYNPGLRETAYDLQRQAIVVKPNHIFGSQALLLSRHAVEFVVSRWHRASGMQDIRISRLVGRLDAPIYYHAPSLVQHVGRCSVWGGGFHQATDFDRDWRA